MPSNGFSSIPFAYPAEKKRHPLLPGLTPGGAYFGPTDKKWPRTELNSRMDVNFFVKKLPTIDDSPALAILDRFSQDNLEPFFISSGEICVAFHANCVSLASSSVMTAAAFDLPC